MFFPRLYFEADWILYDYKLEENNKVIYEKCTFKKNVENHIPNTSLHTDKYRFKQNYPKEYKPLDNREDELSFYQDNVKIYHYPQFDERCTFNGLASIVEDMYIDGNNSSKEIKANMVFKNVKFKEKLFTKTKSEYVHPLRYIGILELENCIFDKPFVLNGVIVKEFICKDTTFRNKSKFEFKNNLIDKLEIENTNFKALVDCYKTKFQSFSIEKSIFEKFTGFEQCKFGEFKKEDNVVIFEYATFLDFVNFRDVKFHSGLDLRNTNFKEAPNFLDVHVEAKNTNRETFRIIKHSFDSVGNIIEANKFFAYEMRKERENPSKRDFFYKLMLDLNYLISDFGQSWIKPFLWIIYFLCLEFLVFCLMDNWKFDNDSIRDFWIGLNQTVHDFMPFKKFLVTGKEFISLMFLIIYSTLIYNFIVAVKRITKR